MFFENWKCRFPAINADSVSNNCQQLQYNVEQRAEQRLTERRVAHHQVLDQDVRRTDQVHAALLSDLMQGEQQGFTVLKG